MLFNYLKTNLFFINYFFLIFFMGFIFLSNISDDDKRKNKIIIKFVLPLVVVVGILIMFLVGLFG